MSTDNSSKQIVETFLNGIGLGHAIGSFTKAGIVTPSALSELSINHFEALGVVDPDDRRKLFFLVERIKLSVPKIEDEATEQELPSKTRLSNIAKAGRDKNDAEASDNDSEIVTKSQTNRRERALRKTSYSSYSPRRTRSMTTQAKKSVSFGSNDDDTENRDRDEEESVGADDEASSRHSTGLRTNRRLRNRSQGSAVSVEMVQQNVSTPESKEKRTAMLRKSNSSDGSSETSTMQKSASLGQEEASNELISTKQVARKSKMQMPRARRTDNLISMRTGKQLSCIPADSIAPASPLVTLPVSRLEADIKAQQRLENHKSTRKIGTRRSRSLSSESGRESAKSMSESENEGNSSNSESKRTHRTSNGQRSHGNDDGQTDRMQMHSKTKHANDKRSTSRSTSLRDVKSSSSGVTKPVDRRSLPGNKCFIGENNDKTLSGSKAQGGSGSTSWASQVAKLRDDNQTEYDLFHADAYASSSDESMRIRVVIRKRPMSKLESAAVGEMDIIHPLSFSRYGKILVYQPKTRLDLTKEVETAQFAFDNVFDESSTNTQIYQRAVSKLIPGVIDGQQVSVFAYGQTGSGKSFTMLGSNLTGMVAGTAVACCENEGLYYLAAVDLFKILQNTRMSVTVSLFEIYGKKLFDLLGDRAIVKCLEDAAGKMQFKGLTEHPIHSAKSLLELIELGARLRSTGSTSRNADSSRSHAVLQIYVRKDGAHAGGHQHGRLTFIDLAGSERGSDTSTASQATRIESSEINSSLLCLKEVIRALATGDHVPFRGCKLTQVLKDSFVGTNSRCVMLGCISPNQSNCDHTLNTLHYCNRLKERISETGELPSRPAHGHKHGGTARRQFSASETGYEAEASSALDETDEDRRRVYRNSFSDDDSGPDNLLVGEHTSADGNDSAVLDNLLASSSVRSSSDSHEVYSTSLPLEPTSGGQAQSPSSLNKQRGELVAIHKAVLTALLSIVKEEMELANRLGSDRDGLETHLSVIDNVQARKIELISELNQALFEYRNCAGDTTVHSDDSFEDLRD